jgi:hypothetical protein
MITVFCCANFGDNLQLLAEKWQSEEFASFLNAFAASCQHFSENWFARPLICSMHNTVKISLSLVSTS